MSHLSSLGIGERAVVTGYVQKDKALRKKLLAMGLVKGVEIKMIRMAPLGDPVEIELRGFKLSLRKEEAEALDIEIRG
ncbi:MAG: ferrous iron transport protein A [Deltaproteobacteria bacterium]|nr:MAG: ferrous iron transport protein A [Deltaproteobacteria bacterium]